MRNLAFLMTLYEPQDQRNKRFFQYAFGDPFQPLLWPGQARPWFLKHLYFDLTMNNAMRRGGIKSLTISDVKCNGVVEM